MHTKLLTPPATTAVTLANLKLQLKTSSSESDVYLTTLMEGVIEFAQSVTATLYITQTHTVYMDAFPSSDIIELPFSPLQSVTSIKYYNDSGDLVTWDSANYIVSDASRIARIQAVNGWPTAKNRIDAIQIEAVFGYGDADTDVPKSIQNAIILMSRYLYDNPADPVSAKQTAADRYLQSEKVYRKIQ